MDFPVGIQIQKTLRFKVSVAIYALVIYPRGELKKKFKTQQNKTKNPHTHQNKQTEKTTNKQTNSKILFYQKTTFCYLPFFGVLNTPWTWNNQFLP